MFSKEELEAIRLWAMGELGHTQRVDIPRAICLAIIAKIKIQEKLSKYG